MTTIPALYSGVPTLHVDDEASAVLEASVTSMVVEDADDGLATCEVTFQNAGITDSGVGFPLFDEQLIDFGSALRIEAGGGDSFGVLFDGTVTGLEAMFLQADTARLIVLADDPLNSLRRTRRTRVFEDMTDADVIGQIADEHGLTAEVPDGTSMHRAIAQFDQSDLAFVRERARRLGADVAVDGDRLLVAPRRDRRGEAIACAFRQNLREASLLADTGRVVTEVAVSGWDPSTKEAIDVTAGPSTIAAERLPLGTAGFELVQRTDGVVRDRPLHIAPFAVDEAQAVADARFRRLARRFVSGRVVLEGDARVGVGAVVELSGIGTWYSGAYDVVAVQHVFDLDDGFRTIATVERAELAR